MKLCAEDGSELRLNLWDDTQRLARGHSVGDILYMFNAYLAREDVGGAHLAARTTTRILKASMLLPLTEALAEKDLANLPASQKTSLSSGCYLVDPKSGKAVLTNVAILDFAASSRTSIHPKDSGGAPPFPPEGCPMNRFVSSRSIEPSGNPRGSGDGGGEEHRGVHHNPYS